MSNHSNEQFVKDNKFSIYAILRDIQKNNTAVLLSYARGQFISKVLDVLPETNQLIIDLSSVAHENRLALTAERLTFVAEPTGAKVEFSLPTLTQVIYQALPAFSCPIPEKLYFIQRREYFRVNTPLTAVFYCQGKMSNDQSFRYAIKDISLGGICLSADQDSELTLPEGAIVRNAELELAEFGTFRLDLQYISTVQRKIVDGKGETRTLKRVSFKFPHLTAQQSKELQRVIFELEKLQNDRNKQVRT